jgi:hypothetical protein
MESVKGHAQVSKVLDIGLQGLLYVKGARALRLIGDVIKFSS